MDPKKHQSVKDDFNERVIIVTGAAQGIGFEVARQFAQRGAVLALIDVQKDQLLRAAETLRSEEEADITTWACDLTDEKAVHSVVNDIIKTTGHIDVLAHLAGTYWRELFLDTSTDDYRKMFRINVDPCFFLAQAILPHMQKAHYGRIIFTASQLAHQPVEGFATYSAAKSAVVGFTRGIAQEAGEGITVNAVLPTIIATETTKSLPRLQPIFEFAKGGQLVKRVGVPEDVAHAILYFASPGAEFITGQTLNINGGSYM